MAKPKTTPIKIYAEMLDGRLNSADGIVMFDGILYHAWFAKHAPYVLEDGGMDSFSGYFGLPLRQLPHNRYAASMGIYKEIRKEIDHLNKRPDFFAADKMDKLDAHGIISGSVGKFRSWRIPNVIRIIEDATIVFYAMGHKDEVAELLKLISGAGKKNAAGYGVITDWAIEDCDEDYSLYHPDYGLMRPALPEELENLERADREELRFMRYGIRPPYWKPCNMMECYVPRQRE